jgi:hypothetical protein
MPLKNKIASVYLCSVIIAKTKSLVMKKKIYQENRCGLCGLVSGNYYLLPSFALLIDKNEVYFEEVK